MDGIGLVQIAASVVNPVLLTGFLIPQVQTLKEVRDKLIRYRFAHVSDRDNHSAEQQVMEVREFDNILKAYAVRAKDVKRLAYLFFLSLLFIVISILLIAACPSHALAVGLSHLLSQIGIAGGGLYAYAVQPDKLRKIDFLVHELDINPISIMNALEIDYSIGYAGQEPFPYDRSAPLDIFMSPNLRLYGYRLFCVVHDSATNVYFVSWGLVSGKSKWYRHMLPDDEIFGGEVNRLSIGSLAFNRIVEKQKQLSFALFLFLPFYKTEVLNPFYSTVQMPTQEVAGSTLGSNRISGFKRHKGILFRGKGEKLFSVEILNDEDFLCRLVGRYEKRIRTARKLQHWGSMDGVALRLEVGKAER